MQPDVGIRIRAIQHFLYCPRQFALIDLDCAWAENEHVVQANLMHDNVHSTGKRSGRNGYSLSSVQVYHDGLDIHGVVDCLEFVFDENGDYKDSKGNLCGVNIIEYKPTAPAKDKGAITAEMMQVYAQKICVDSMFNVNSRGFFYYGDTKRRVEIDFDCQREQFKDLLQTSLEKMHDILLTGKIPDKQNGQNCSGCSLRDTCMPRQGSKISIRDLLKQHVDEEIL